MTFESDIYHGENNEKLSFGSILKNPIRILEVFGNLSYGVYIWHFPLIEKLTPIFTSSIPIEAFYKRVIATLILSTVLATVTYYLVELPFARQKTFAQIKKLYILLFSTLSVCAVFYGIANNVLNSTFYFY